jgi:PAS domain S-box-containing protein
LALALPAAHRLARVNYAPRALAFAYSFLVLEALMLERGFSGWVLFFGALQFVVYPHLAYLYARVARDSKQAELNSLLLDALMLGLWAAQMQYALWWSGGLLAAVSLNNAANGGLRRLGLGMLVFAAGALLWGAARGFEFAPATGSLVSTLCLAGIIVYVSWVGLIIHEQNRRLVRVRDALHSSEEQFRFIAEHAGDLVAVLDPKGRFRYVSASHAQYFDPALAVPGQDWLKLVHADDRERARNFVQYMLLSQSPERMSLRMLPLQGPSRIVECEGNPVVNHREGASMIILVMRDITARVRAEIDLRLAAHAFDHLSDGVLLSDGSGSIEYVNKAYCALTGHEPQELVGRMTTDIRTGLRSDGLYEEIWQSVQRGGSWRGRFMEQRKDGKFIPVWAVVSAVRDKGGAATHYVWVISEASREQAARTA